MGHRQFGDQGNNVGQFSNHEPCPSGQGNLIWQDFLFFLFLFLGFYNQANNSYKVVARFGEPFK